MAIIAESANIMTRNLDSDIYKDGTGFCSCASDDVFTSFKTLKQKELISSGDSMKTES